MRRAFSGTLSLKLRTGWDARSIVAPEMARAAAAEGVELVSVHGRTRAQQYTGSADREAIRRVVDAVPQLPVLANGDVTTPQQVFATLRETGASGVMIGRGALGNPWVFEQTLACAEGRAPREPGPAERLQTLLRHAALLAGCFEDERVFASNLKKYVAAYAKGLHGCAAFRQATLEAQGSAEILERARRFFGEARAAA
jgi:tRNA-dihydrouridine synthase